jgi:hypothetical protein
MAAAISNDSSLLELEQKGITLLLLLTDVAGKKLFKKCVGLFSNRRK